MTVQPDRRPGTVLAAEPEVVLGPTAGALTLDQALAVPRSPTATPTCAATSPTSSEACSGTPRFIDGAHGALLPDAASQERAEAVVLPALAAIIRSSEIRDTGRRIVTGRADALRTLTDHDSGRTSPGT